MTPENDVNKDSENKGGDEPLQGDFSANTDKSVSKAADGIPADELNAKSAADDALDGIGESASGAVANDASESAESNDIDRAVSAQTAADEAIAKAMNGGDDPLGFGDQRMQSDASAGDEPSEADPAASSDPVAVLQAQLGESEAKVANQTDQLLRLQAEMENQRKRAQNDVSKAHKFALEKIALDLLPVKDSLEMGLQAATGTDAEPAKIIEGSELTLKMLAQALEKYNIVEINPVDEKFDPEFHQAMSMQPVEGKEPNTVASVMQKGYTLNDRLIRPALVMVAK